MSKSSVATLARAPTRLVTHSPAVEKLDHLCDHFAPLTSGNREPADDAGRVTWERSVAASRKVDDRAPVPEITLGDQA